MIRSLSNLFILGLSWLKKYNLQIDYIFYNINFFCSLAQNSLNQVETYKSNISKLLLIHARTFMYFAKKESPFAVYATSIFDGKKL